MAAVGVSGKVEAVDHDVGAQFEPGPGLLGAAHHADHAGTGRLSEWDARAADAANRGGMDVEGPPV